MTEDDTTSTADRGGLSSAAAGRSGGAADAAGASAASAATASAASAIAASASSARATADGILTRAGAADARPGALEPADGILARETPPEPEPDTALEPAEGILERENPPEPEPDTALEPAEGILARETPELEPDRGPAPDPEPADADADPATGLGRHRGFLLLWGGETVSQFGAQLALLAIPVLAVTLLGASEWQVGLLNAADTAAFLVIGLPVGAWVDRMRKRRVMIVADLVRAAALAAIPALWAAGMLEMWHVYAVALVVGGATVFFDVSYQSFIPVLVPGRFVSGANGRLEASAQIARIGGPALGGGLLALVGAPFVLAATAVGYLVSWLCLAGIRVEETPPPRAERRPLLREIGEGLAFVWGHRLIRRITATTGAFNLSATITFTLLPVLVLRTLGLSPTFYGIVMSFGAIGGVLGAALTPWLTRRVGEGSIIVLASVVSGAAAFAVPLAATLPAAALPLLIGGELLQSFAVLVYNVAQLSFRQRVCPKPLLGRMNASIRCVVWGVMPLGALLAGGLGEWLGIEATMWIGAVLGLSAVAIMLFSPLRGMRTLPSAPE